MTRTYFGFAGHFIGGRYCVSTLGACWPLYQRKGDCQEYVTIGSNRLYETMVFLLDENGGVSDWSGIDDDAYNDEDAADAGHEAMV